LKRYYQLFWSGARPALGLGQLAEPLILDWARSFLFTDFGLSFGTETVRVRIGDWRSRKLGLRSEEETQPEKEQKTKRQLLI
jgi:hypothetical protein